jgi:hypothetical protein
MKHRQGVLSDRAVRTVSLDYSTEDPERKMAVFVIEKHRVLD